MARFETGITTTLAMGATALVTSVVLWIIDVRARRPLRRHADLGLGVRF